MHDPLDLEYICPLPEGEIKYGLRGSGPPVLLIMGFMARGRAWRAQIEALASHYTVLWFDHRGVGESTGPAAKSMSEFASDCLHLLDHLAWTKAHVIGISMGGMIAQEFAVTYSERVSSLALIVTHFGSWHRVIPPMRGIPLFLKAQFAKSMPKRLEALKELLVPKSVLAMADHELILSKLREDFSPKPPFTTRYRHIRAILGHNTQKRLKNLTKACLVIQAQGDLLVNPKHSLALQKAIPNAKLVSFKEAGHGIVRQSNISVNEHLLQHLQEVEEQSAERSP